jgi:hypothetical protein
MPAVLDRPHPLAGELARPAQRFEMPGLASSDRALAQDLASSRIHGHQRVVALVRIRPDHDHLHRPFVWMSTAKRIFGGQTSLGAMPRSLSVQGS